MKKIKVPFRNLSIKSPAQRKKLLRAIDKVFQHGRFILGPEVQELERQVAGFCQRKYAVGVSNGTAALFMALKAMGLTKGGEVITTPLSWIATANAIILAGGKPVFADIRQDLNINPAAIEKLITKKTKLILPVHYTGKICDMEKIMDLSRRYKIPVIEDAAQAYGAKYNELPAGYWGKLACFSLNSMKVLPSCGEAGMIVLDDQLLYKKLLALRENGMIEKEKCVMPSLNFRIATVQAALLLERLKCLNNNIRHRKKIADKYYKNLKEIVSVPFEKEPEDDVYFFYTIKTAARDQLKLFLEQQGIEVKIREAKLIPQQKAYKKLFHGRFPQAKKIRKTILSLPISEELTFKEVDYVIEKIKEFFKK